MTLRYGRHVLEVQLRDVEQGSLGQAKYVNVGEPIPIRGNWQPLDSVEILNRGLQDVITARFSTFGAWPGERNSLVFHGGWEWEIVSQEYPDMSETTKHWVIILKRGRPHGSGQ